MHLYHGMETRLNSHSQATSLAGTFSFLKAAGTTTVRCLTLGQQCCGLALKPQKPSLMKITIFTIYINPKTDARKGKFSFFPFLPGRCIIGLVWDLPYFCPTNYTCYVSE